MASAAPVNSTGLISLAALASFEDLVLCCLG
jgi:hypothetical protein